MTICHPAVCTGVLSVRSEGPPRVTSKDKVTGSGLGTLVSGLSKQILVLPLPAGRQVSRGVLSRVTCLRGDGAGPGSHGSAGVTEDTAHTGSPTGWGCPSRLS